MMPPPESSGFAYQNVPTDTPVPSWMGSFVLKARYVSPIHPQGEAKKERKGPGREGKRLEIDLTRSTFAR